MGGLYPQHFAQLYFLGSEEDDDPKKPKGQPQPPGQSAAPASGAYRTISQGDPQQQRPPGGPAGTPAGKPDPTNPLGAPPAGQVPPDHAAAPGTTSPAPGQSQGVTPQQLAGPDGQQALQQLMTFLPSLLGSGLGGLGGGLGGLTSLIPGLGGGGLHGLGGGLGGGLGHGLGGLFHHGADAQKFAAQYFQGNGAFLDEESGGGDWADLPFQGSGPSRKDYSGTSEHYVEKHEKPKRSETWMTDNDGDVIKYTDRPKQFKSADAGAGMGGYNAAPAMSGGHLSTGGSGHGLGHGGFESAESHGPNHTMGELAGLVTAAGPGTGFFNPRNPHVQAFDKEEFTPKGPGKKKGPKKPGDDDDSGSDPLDALNPLGGGKGGPGLDAIGGEAAAGGEAAELAPLLMAASNDHSDVVRMFQASGGGCISAAPQNDRFSDDRIASAARGMLKQAGRNYSLAEQRELENESHPKGARNLRDLDLRNTHYVD